MKWKEERASESYLPPNSWVILGKLLSISELQFLYTVRTIVPTIQCPTKGMFRLKRRAARQHPSASPSSDSLVGPRAGGRWERSWRQEAALLGTHCEGPREQGPGETRSRGLEEDEAVGGFAPCEGRDGGGGRMRLGLRGGAVPEEQWEGRDRMQVNDPLPSPCREAGKRSGREMFVM